MKFYFQTIDVAQHRGNSRQYREIRTKI